MPNQPRDQFLDLPEGDPLSTEHLDEKVQQAEQQEQSLKRQLETVEKQKRELEELSRRQDVLNTGRNEMVEKLTRAVVIVDRETLDARKRLELLDTIHSSFAQHLETLGSINPKSWEGSEVQRELTRALAAVDDARGEYNRSYPRICSIPEQTAGAPASEGGYTSDNSVGDSKDFIGWLKIGFALSLPIIVLGLFALVVIISRMPAK